ncbi:hypothetical protein W03_01870 [Nitrosomonas sp. PY1]|uniref:DUF5658 family protein n=1 Tax=Nitrosomonas sp. PY1 TaxID=1803906 RepID=UPI001FC8C29D|nr:DUF5658 family protein [Nitrosomonas sp. PY1]GKS68183.1 hypothetical protein W03_01870 [Nitrosomonas sp. PY1]
MTGQLAASEEGRSGQDRRSDTSFFCPFHLGIKSGSRGRVGERRLNGKEWSYVDYYPNHLLFCIVAILVLSILDVYFTLNILARGGEELNWFMLVVIEESIEKFISVKLALTGLALVFLTIHHNVKYFQKLRVRHIIYIVLTGYVVLIGYEALLLNWII